VVSGNPPEPIAPLPKDGSTSVVAVTAAEVLGHYRLKLGFSDGSSRELDLTGELSGPIFDPLSDPAFFAQVQVDKDLGTITWPNGADLPAGASRRL
jgi:hypothetical protein